MWGLTRATVGEADMRAERLEKKASGCEIAADNKEEGRRKQQ